MNDSKNNYRYLYNLPEDITSLPLYWTTERECASMNTLRPKFGGATWSRTKIVYPEGTDLQSADAHAIASIAPYRNTLRILY